MAKFKPFTINPKQPDKSHCNARVWAVGGKEQYCPEPGTSVGERCYRHNLAIRQKAAREERELEALKNASSIEERAEELGKQKENLTSLDKQVLHSLAVIQHFEDWYSDNTLQKADAVFLSKLRREHADLVHKRADLALKLKAIVDGDFIFSRMQRLFEDHLDDVQKRLVLMEEVGKMLDELVTKETKKK